MAYTTTSGTLLFATDGRIMMPNISLTPCRRARYSQPFETEPALRRDEFRPRAASVGAYCLADDDKR